MQVEEQDVIGRKLKETISAGLVQPTHQTNGVSAGIGWSQMEERTTVTDNDPLSPTWLASVPCWRDW